MNPTQYVTRFSLMVQARTAFKTVFCNRDEIQMMGWTNNCVKYVICLHHTLLDLFSLIVLSHNICAQQKPNITNQILVWNSNRKSEMFYVNKHPSHPLCLYTGTRTERMTILKITCQEIYWETNTHVQEHDTTLTNWERSLRNSKLGRYKSQ